MGRLAGRMNLDGCIVELKCDRAATSVFCQGSRSSRSKFVRSSEIESSFGSQRQSNWRFVSGSRECARHCRRLLPEVSEPEPRERMCPSGRPTEVKVAYTALHILKEISRKIESGAPPPLGFLGRPAWSTTVSAHVVPTRCFLLLPPKKHQKKAHAAIEEGLVLRGRAEQREQPFSAVPIFSVGRG